MRELTSVKNPIVQFSRALEKARDRAQQQAFLLDGEHMVSEAIAACPEKLRTLFVDMQRVEAFAALLARADSRTEQYAVPQHVLSAISQVKTPQGIAAVCELSNPTPLDALGDKLLLLENVQDPGNVGTILRTLDAAGFDGCILTSGCAELYSPKVLRATMGSIFRVPVAIAQDAIEAVQWLNSCNYATIAGALDGTPFYEREKLPQKICVMIGNEGAGLTDAVLAACTHRYQLPMRGGAESLNAGIAAGIFMYEIMNH